jgi:prolyl-tRNA synthetase
MKYSTLLIPTLKEAPAEAELASHALLIRGGYVRKLSAGVYSFLPLAWKCLRKVEEIIRAEMVRGGAQELLLPMVHPAEIWQESGRWYKYGSELLRFKDRKQGDFCLAPTHEEAITELVRSNVRSYRELPKNLFQIQFKFRDEPRPRGGLLRCREFIMKDGYSFDVNPEAARKSYERMYQAYNRIFTRIGFRFRPVQADTGAIGGSMSHEFQALADSGEDAMLACTACDWAANVEKAEVALKPVALNPSGRLPRAVPTPNVRTVEEVAAFLGVTPDRVVKTLLYLADGKPIAALVRGDQELNEVKLKKVAGASELEMADADTVVRVTGAPVGFAGPVGLQAVPLYLDQAVAAMVDFVVGGNAADTHLVDCCPRRDFTPTAVADLRVATEADPCPVCGQPLKSYRGIELGHVFYLGTRYSAPMKAHFLDAEGREVPFDMGCYGIGVSRILPAIVEQSHDERGIVWPVAVAPFEAMILPLQADAPALKDYAEQLYAELGAAGVDVLLDDREERAGVKFNDADLLGVPFQVVIGKKSFDQGLAEIKVRATGVKQSVPLKEVASALRILIAEAYARLDPDRPS